MKLSISFFFALIFFASLSLASSIEIYSGVQFNTTQSNSSVTFVHTIYDGQVSHSIADEIAIESKNVTIRNMTCSTNSFLSTLFFWANSNQDNDTSTFCFVPGLVPLEMDRITESLSVRIIKTVIICLIIGLLIFAMLWMVISLYYNYGDIVIGQFIGFAVIFLIFLFLVIELVKYIGTLF